MPTYTPREMRSGIALHARRSLPTHACRPARRVIPVSKGDSGLTRIPDFHMTVNF